MVLTIGFHLQDDELNTVKSEGGSQITESPTKKRAYVRRKSGEKEAIKRWEDGEFSSPRTETILSATPNHHFFWTTAEITALWRSIYKIVKQNVPELVATPEVSSIFRLNRSDRSRG
jgi:hypothetical protein